MIHTVRSGETLFSIAQRYNIDPNNLARINNITNPNEITVGQNLFIPLSRITSYQIKNGDTLYSIARSNGILLNDLITANPQISNPNMLNVGDTINIPDVRKEIEINGYAIPSINQSILNDTLEYLTYLSPFSYQVNMDGSLSQLNDETLISSARNSGVAPIMVVTNISSEGGFDGEIAHKVFTDVTTKQSLINAIKSIAVDKNYLGVDIDFEYLLPEDRDNYTAFLRELKTELEGINKTLSVAVAPKNRDNMAGSLYQAHDYKAIGEIADRVIIMTYEWGYIYGEPQAISPYNQVEKVIAYAVTQIPSQKILMGMPNYAYDWVIPYVQGTSAKTITNRQALRLAYENNATIMFDTLSKAPYFSYSDSDGREHVVWFDDALSIGSRLDIVTKYNLGGLSYWTINNFDSANWAIVSDTFRIKKVM